MAEIQFIRQLINQRFLAVARRYLLGQETAASHATLPRGSNLAPALAARPASQAGLFRGADRSW